MKPELGLYPYEIMCVKKELQKFSETYGFDRKKRLYELLKLPYDERQGLPVKNMADWRK